MNKQPEALRLAKKLEEGYVAHETVLYPAAAELRRLHEVNQELLAALKALNLYETMDGLEALATERAVRAALLKAEGYV
jgi:hypothetical protein